MKKQIIKKFRIILVLLLATVTIIFLHNVFYIALLKGFDLVLIFKNIFTYIITFNILLVLILLTNK